MTSSSRRKRPTTARSTSRASKPLLRACGLAIAALTATVIPARAADWRELETRARESAADETPAGGARLVSAESVAGEGPCGDETEDCKQQLQSLRDDTLSSIDLDIRVSGKAGSDYPCECRLEGETFEPRQFATTMFTWKAAGYCHKPLYFEHWNLERYGHSHGFAADSVCSAAHFFATLPALPYKMGVELPWECVYPLGYYRPGSCAPWTVPAMPISARGLAIQAATVTGIVFIVP